MSREHSHDLSPWQHGHLYEFGNRPAERAAWQVVWVTLAAMLVEIGAGWLFGSLALLADGWHMGTHAGAVGLAALAYALARHWAADARFAFGTWKIEVLGAFTSAVLLAVVAAYVAIESLLRFLNPVAIRFDEAIVVAIFGLAVNLACAWVLGGHRHAGHAHEHGSHSHTDLNMESAYAHVIADAATSVLAIGALVGGKLAGWVWLDPAAGLVGAALIGRWSYGLIVESSKTLLDREMDNPLVAAVRERLEADGDAKVADLHLWRIGPQRYAMVVTLVANRPLSADAYRERLKGHPELVHVSIEVNACPAC
jgi:cation diffusion facilitator family transporter